MRRGPRRPSLRPGPRYDPGVARHRPRALAHADADRHADPVSHGVADTFADSDLHADGAADDRSFPGRRFLAGILVGDFATSEDANTAVVDIHAAFGESAPVEVVDSTTAPNIVRPGVWAAVLLLPAGVDPLAALTDFRARLPQYQGWSWVVAV